MLNSNLNIQYVKKELKKQIHIPKMLELHLIDPTSLDNGL